MELKRFRKNNKRIIMIIIAVVTLIALVVSTTRVMSHAYFKTTKSFNIIQGKIPNKSGDVTLAILVDQAKQNTFPDKKNYKYVETVCNEDSNADINFDPNTWKLNITNINSKTICTIKFESKNEYEEEILKGSYPVIKDELVPVVIADNGTVTKANTKDEWYSYENSRWANAVILTKADNYQVGQTIPEEAIESYFVWIPKYRYKLFNVEGNEIPEQEIKIEFGITDTTNSDTECVAPNISGDIGTCSNGKWMTHPAFTSLGVNGIWVGKFETGYKGSTDTASAEKNENAPEKVQIKPNVNSWRSITVSNMYNTSFNYKRNLDSHMMKNTEWGAMAYLTNSKYGRGNTEVVANLNSSFITGCTNTTTYFNNSTAASTTNNYSGIYDTNGCAWDSMMCNYNNIALSSGLEPSNIPDKYIDRYTGRTVSYRILGDAIQETYGWFNVRNRFFREDATWLDRGGHYNNGSDTGIFAFDLDYGKTYKMGSFRIVLSPIN